VLRRVSKSLTTGYDKRPSESPLASRIVALSMIAAFEKRTVTDRHHPQ
jgi:hypothetical protein